MKHLPLLLCTALCKGLLFYNGTILLWHAAVVIGKGKMEEDMVKVNKCLNMERVKLNILNSNSIFFLIDLDELYYKFCFIISVYVVKMVSCLSSSYLLPCKPLLFQVKNLKDAAMVSEHESIRPSRNCKSINQGNITWFADRKNRSQKSHRRWMWNCLEWGENAFIKNSLIATTG